MKRIFILALTILLGTSAPVYAGGGLGDLAVSLVGAGVGAFAGNQFGHGTGRYLFTIVGAGAGGYLGHRLASSNFGSGSNYGRSTYYQRPFYFETKYAPNYVAPEAYIDNTCRPFAQTVNINGRWQPIYITACLQPDGRWRVVQ